MMKKTVLKLAVLLTIIININNISAQEIRTFTDERDGKVYKTVQIGTQIWMAENLNYESTKSVAYFGTTEFAGISWWNDSVEYTKKYGRLYTYKNALDVCPLGWHLPSETEWNKVDQMSGGRPSGAKNIKSSEGWKNEGNGTNSIGLNILPAGSYNKHNEEFFGLTILANLWTSTLAPDNYKGKAFYRSFTYSKDRINSNFLKFENALSVRCIKD